MSEARKVSLLTAEDLGRTVSAAGRVKFTEFMLSSRSVTYSEEVRIEGPLRSFEPKPVDPRAEAHEVSSVTAKYPGPGYVVNIGGVTLIVPKGNVVVFP